MNGGKVYYSLNSKLNNDLIKIIQQYNIIGNKYNKYLLMKDLISNTVGIYLRLNSLYYFNLTKTVNKRLNCKLYWFLR